MSASSAETPSAMSARTSYPLDAKRRKLRVAIITGKSAATHPRHRHCPPSLLILVCRSLPRVLHRHPRREFLAQGGWRDADACPSVGASQRRRPRSHRLRTRDWHGEHRSSERGNAAMLASSPWSILPSALCPLPGAPIVDELCWSPSCRHFRSAPRHLSRTQAQLLEAPLRPSLAAVQA